MTFVRSSVSMLAVAAALGIAGCVTTSGNLTRSAERLEHSADELRRDARDVGSGNSYMSDAERFADEAHDFRNVIDDRRAGEDDVHDAFGDLQRSYHDLRDEVERSHNREADEDFQPMTEAYLDVEREMRGYRHDDDRYARDEPRRY